MLAVGLRLAGGWATHSFSHPQLFEYEDIARSLLLGEGFVYRHLGGVKYYAFDAPLYPSICAAVYWLTGGSVSALLFVQIMVAGATTFFVSVLSYRLFGWRAGLFSGLLVAVHPGLIIYASLKVHQLVFDVLCFIWLFWQLLEVYAKRTVRVYLVLGLAFGISLLERPTAAAFLPVAIAWLILTKPKNERPREFRLGAAVLIVACLVIAPWIARNAFRLHHFVFIRSTNWEVFWRGNNPEATGHSYINANQTVLDSLSAKSLQELKSLPDELAQGQWFREQAFAFIRQHPGSFAWLTLKKFYYFWWFAPQSGVRYPKGWLLGYKGFYSVILLFSIIGGWGLLRSGTQVQRHSLFLIVAMLLALSFVYSFHYVEGRHRWAVEPLIIIIAGVGVSRFWSMMQSNSVTPGK